MNFKLDFWGRGPGIESGIFNNDPDALQDHFVIMYKRKKPQGREGNLPLTQKKSKNENGYQSKKMCPPNCRYLTSPAQKKV